MRLVCTHEYDRETRLNVEFVVRDGHYDRLFVREFHVQTKAELLALLTLLKVSIASTFEEVPDPEPDILQVELTEAEKAAL